MMYKKLSAHLLILAFLIGSHLVGSAQNNLFLNLQSTLKRANTEYKKGSYSSAVDLYKRATRKKKTSPDVFLKIADCYRILNNMPEAEVWYRKIIDNNSVVGNIDQLHFAQILMANGKYEESKHWFRKYQSTASFDSTGIRKIIAIENIGLFFEDSLCYIIHPVNINTVYDEDSPSYYENGIVFSSSRIYYSPIRYKNAKDDSFFRDLYFSQIINKDTLLAPVKFDAKINTPFNEGKAVFYNNDNSIIYTGNNKQKSADDSVRTLLLLTAEKNKSGNWHHVHALFHGYSSSSFGHPAINSDGTILYFVSNIPGGYGGTDIYISNLKGLSWSAPINAGPSVNTPGNEMFPFILHDTLLYFSSNGRAGLGGLDIYSAVKKEKSFVNIKNIGYPINSGKDDFGIILAPDGKSGFFSSNRTTGNGDDIYSFEKITVTIKGFVADTIQNEFLKGAIIKVYYRNQYISHSISNEDGSFSLLLDPGKKYTLKVEKENYESLRTTISTTPGQYNSNGYNNIFLQKNYKSIIRGVVRKDYDNVLPHQLVMYKEVNSHHTDTITTDEHGEFHIETHPDKNYLFFTKKDNTFGKVTVLNNGKKKSTLYYTSIEMRNYSTPLVKGVVKDKKGAVEKATVIIHDEITEKSDTLYTDKDGRFIFKANSYSVYTIIAVLDKKVAVINNFSTSVSPKKELEFILPELLQRK